MWQLPSWPTPALLSLLPMPLAFSRTLGDISLFPAAANDNTLQLSWPHCEQSAPLLLQASYPNPLSSFPSNSSCLLLGWGLEDPPPPAGNEGMLVRHS